jgi:hypothetical protein
MDSYLIYSKTPAGDEAVRQSTRVVQRNLRMVLVLVDGKTSVEDLVAKVGNPRLVQSALRELKEGGFIVPLGDAASAWADSRMSAMHDTSSGSFPPMSQFSALGPVSRGLADAQKADKVPSNFSSFGKPILPSTLNVGRAAAQPVAAAETYQPDYQEHHQGMSAGRKALLAIAALLAVLLATLVFYPYEQFKPAIEASATRLLDVPVRIDRVAVSFFPTPSLKLTGLHLGDLDGGKISEVRIGSPLSLLGSAPYKVARIEVSGASLTANHLVAFPMFMGKTGGSPDLLVQKLVIDHFQLRLGESLVFNDLFGEIAFRLDGAVEKATIETADRSVLVNALPGSAGMVLSIEGRAWTPAGAPVSFASLQAKGLLQKNKLLIQNIDTTFLGGILRGNWLLDWSNGLVMAGEGSLSGLDSRKVSTAFAPTLNIDGDMSGTVRLRASGRDWNSLWGNLEAVLSTEITRGTFHGVDLGEAVRRGGGAEVRAGVTRFDRLRSTINITPTQLVGRDIKMDAGMVTATGQFSAGRNGSVESNMMVTMQTSVSSQNAAVRIYGVLPSLSATTRK